MNLELMMPYFDLATQLATILGIPIAIFVYLREQKAQRTEREYGTYNALDDKYIELQQLCLQYPELDVFDTPKKDTHSLSEDQTKQEEAILLIRIAIFERAFLMYEGHKNIVKDSQWKGWVLEMVEWMERDNFRRIWEEQSPYFDLNFKRFLDDECGISVQPSPSIGGEYFDDYSFGGAFKITNLFYQYVESMTDLNDFQMYNPSTEGINVVSHIQESTT